LSADGLEATLHALLARIAQRSEIGSAVIVIPTPESEGYVIAASFGLDAAAVDGLTGAMARPGHPIVRTFAESSPTYDVMPINPGGPALRSHLPLVVRRNEADLVVGVLALAHDKPIEADVRADIEAVSHLAALAIDRAGAG
jgi:hypothetical protein